MRVRLDRWHRWSSEHFIAVAIGILVVAGVVGGWDMLQTGIIARFAEGTGADPPSAPQIPLEVIGLIAGALAAWLIGQGRPTRWRAGAFVIIVNGESTKLDHHADLVLRGSISTLLGELVAGLR